VLNVNEIIGPYIRLTEVGGFDDVLMQVAELAPDDAIQLCERASKALMEIRPVVDSFNSYIADSRLSGLPMYCSAPECRIRSVYDLAAYAVLYCDQASMVNPFSYAEHMVGLPDEDDAISSFIQELAFAVFVVLTLKPLVERGLVRFFPYSPNKYCRGCIDKVLLGRKRKHVMRDAFDFFASSSRAKVNVDGDLRSVLIEYDERHATHRIYSDLGATWLDDLEHGTPLSRARLVKHGVFLSQSQMLTHDLYAKNIAADELGVKNIFSNDFEFQAVSMMMGVAMERQDVQLDYPILTAITISQALKIRDAEWHHIEEFRSAVRALSGFPAKERAEIIRIEHAKIHRVLSKARRQALGNVLDAAPMAAFSLVATVATSGMSSLLSTAAGLLGGGHVATKAIPALRQSVSIPEEARESRYFYAWRVSRALTGH
jgi:hypothetical protein